MKAIIPVAGIGSRLRPHTHTQPKALIPVAGKPIIAHIIDKLMAAGIDEFVFIIGYLGDKIELFINSEYPQIKTTFVMQPSGKGIGHAIYLAKEQTLNEKALWIVLGDTIFETDLPAIMKKEQSMLGVKKVEDPRLFGVAELAPDGSIRQLIEKPLIPKSNLALVGIYFIKEVPSLFEALEYLITNKIKTHNEYHLTDALMLMIQKGISFQTFDVDNWFDCGKKEVLLQTNELLLKRLKETPKIPAKSEHLIIIPPVYIGKNTRISHSVIGPNVSIGDNVHIHSSIISDSIIGPYAQIENAILKDTLIGNDASLKGMTYTLNLGDSAEINFS